MANDVKSRTAFELLLKAGLWERDITLSSFGEIDYSLIYQLAQEQSVEGLIAAGFDHVLDAKVPKDIALSFVSCALSIEQRNIAMNAFIAELNQKIRYANYYTILVKGQGIAQCYERPLWRSSGDVDLFVDYQSYNEVADFLAQMASAVEENRDDIKHLAMTMGPWEVELHGTLRSQLGKRIDKMIDELQNSVFCEGEVRVWRNGSVDIYLPSADNDVIFIFTHILQHFFRGGIGLRQICDLCRLLWNYKESIDIELLRYRLFAMGVESEWKTFAYIAVNKLGMPVDAMPFYSDANYWSKKARKVLDLIYETGSFGHNRDSSYLKESPVILRRIKSLWRYTWDSCRHFFIFPKDSLRIWRLIVVNRSKVAINK